MKSYKVLIFILVTIILLASVSLLLPPDGITFVGRRLFFPTIEEVLSTDKSVSVEDKMRALEETIKLKAITDSINTARHNARQDSIKFYKTFFTTHSARFHLPGNDFGFFDRLFAAMEQCKTDSSIVHILHYGDSQIEEDRISSYIRQRLQEQFGGIGAGLLPVMQPIPSASVGQSASGAMERYIIAGMHKNSSSSNRYGILGQFATLSGNGSINIRSHNYNRTHANVKSWNVVRLFVNSNSSPLTATLVAGQYSRSKSIEHPKTTPSTIVWHLPDSVKKMTIDLSGNAELSSVSLDGTYGVNVDNIPIRGSSGTFFSKIDKNTIIPVAKELNVKLVLLEFGGNMMPSITSRNIAHYMDILAKQIAYFQEICPNAKVVLIGPADMSTKVRGNLQTYPLLPTLVEEMKKMATASGAGFWNMFDVMGGENSMIEWVKSRPALASPDYIHFTPRGADRIAEMFYESLNNYYQYYKMKKQ